MHLKERTQIRVISSIYYLKDGIFANRWTIKAVSDSTPFETAQDFHIVSEELGELKSVLDLNNPPSSRLWQIFAADT